MDRDTKKALKLAVKALTERRRKYAPYLGMERDGFEEGKRGADRWRELDAAIRIIEGMLATPAQGRLL
jgi:hypothetical protein